MNENIKWCALQPLTGGMYFGTESAVGHPAEFIISYPGFADVINDKNGNLIDANNEYHLVKYLEKVNRTVPYYTFDRKPFDDLGDFKNTRLMKEGVEVPHPDYSNMDLVVAVPVCSGLSLATLGASNETLMLRNNNMIFLANYALNVIRPKVYIFENAPKLSSEGGKPVREILEKIAEDNGYSVVFYRTDTRLHDNCQRRPRTFVYFFKKFEDGRVPLLGFENKQVTIEEFLNRIPKDATHKESFGMLESNQAMLDYAKVTYGDNWRDKVKASALIIQFQKDEKLDAFVEWIKAQPNYSDKVKKYFENYVAHIKYKESLNKGFFVMAPTIAKNGVMPSAMYKTIPYTLHYKEDRLYSIREWLSVMGMPYDFEMHGKPDRFFRRIGQNVPARTAQFIVNEALNAINNWDTVERDELVNSRALLVDNIKGKVFQYT